MSIDGACIAYGTGASVAVSGDPFGGRNGAAPTWAVVPVRPVNSSSGEVDGLSALVCPSVTLCVGTDAVGDILTYTKPAGAAGRWLLTPINTSCAPLDPVCLPGVAYPTCATVTLCEAENAYGEVVGTADPLDPTSWAGVVGAGQGTTVGGFGTDYYAPLLCVTAGLCVGLDEANGYLYQWDPSAAGGDVAGTSDETNGPGFSGEDTAEELWCQSVHLCFAADSGASQDADLFISTDIAAREPGWAVTLPGAGIASMSCPSATRCYALATTQSSTDSVDELYAGGSTIPQRQIDGTLRADLKQVLKPATLGHLEHAHQVTLRLHIPEAGRFTLAVWPLPEKNRTLLIAKGAYATGGIAPVRLTATTAVLQWLAGRRFTATDTLSPIDGGTYSVTITGT